MSGTFSGSDRNGNAVSGFQASPIRPYFNLEGSPYQGDGVRSAIWTFSIGGGHYLFHADENQETVTTGIMGYDSNVPGGDKGMYKRDWLGHASRFFNEHLVRLDPMVPSNNLVDTNAYCLADPGREYVVYSMIGASTTFNLNLTAVAGLTLNCRFYNPRDGQFEPTFQRTCGGTESFTKPDSDDWALHVVVALPGDFDNDGDVDGTDFDLFMVCASGPAVPHGADCEQQDFDADADVDQEDFGVFQRCLSGQNVPSEPDCAD
jgi:hypothetical protein